jgi:hypothetical protein
VATTGVLDCLVGFSSVEENFYVHGNIFEYGRKFHGKGDIKKSGGERGGDACMYIQLFFLSLRRSKVV